MELFLLYLLIGGVAYAAIYSASSKNSYSAPGTAPSSPGAPTPATNIALPLFIKTLNWQGTDVQGFDTQGSASATALGTTLEGALSYYSFVKTSGLASSGKIAITAEKMSAPPTITPGVSPDPQWLPYQLENAGSRFPSPHFVLFVNDLQAFVQAEEQKSPSLLPATVTVFVVDAATVPKLAAKGSDLAVRFQPGDPIAYT